MKIITMSGRRGGRGRGRGGRGPGFVARDEDGNVVMNKKQEGPTPLFPVCTLCPSCKITSISCSDSDEVMTRLFVAYVRCVS